MVPTKCTPKPSPGTNLPSGRQNQRRPQNIEQMPPFEIETVQALKNFGGREAGVSDWHAITQDQVQQFADATGDRQWIHLDRERAQRESPFGASIAHGLLTLSLISSLMKEAAQILGTRLPGNFS